MDKRLPHLPDRLGGSGGSGVSGHPTTLRTSRSLLPLRVHLLCLAGSVPWNLTAVPCQCERLLNPAQLHTLPRLRCPALPCCPAAEYFTGEHRDDYQASDVQDYFMYMGMLASEARHWAGAWGQRAQ